MWPTLSIMRINMGSTIILWPPILGLFSVVTRAWKTLVKAVKAKPPPFPFSSIGCASNTKVCGGIDPSNVPNMNIRQRCLVQLLHQTPIFEWNLVKWGSKNIYKKGVCLQEIRLHTQDTISIISLTLNITLYIFSLEGGFIWQFNEHKNCHFNNEKKYSFKFQKVMNKSGFQPWFGIC